MNKIMGQAQASVEQMRAYVKKVNPKVPQSVIKMIPYYFQFRGNSRGRPWRRCLYSELP